MLRFIELVQRGGLSPVWKTSPVACLTTFARCRFIDYGKAEARRVGRNHILDFEDALASGARTPHEELVHHELTQVLGDAVEGLPVRDRDVFDHFLTGPASAAGTASVLGMTTRQVYERSRSIRTRLRRNATLRRAFQTHVLG